MLPATRFFDDPRYLRTIVAEKPPAGSAREAYDAASLAGCGPGSLILDAACGNGRHAVPLARLGCRVMALDSSRPLLAAGRRAARRAWGTADSGPSPAPPTSWPVVGSSRPRFVHGSYTDMPVQSGAFDAVLCLGTALGYLGKKGDEAALREFRRVLAPGGRLVIETLHRDAIGDGLADHEERVLTLGETLCFDRSFDREESVMHESQRLVASRRRLTTPAEKATVAYDLRVYGITELARMLERTGFRVIGRHASLSAEGEPSPATPLVLVAEAND